MSLYRAMTAAIAGPLGFVLEHPERGPGSPALAALVRGVRAGAELRIPQAARARLAEIAAELEQAADAAALLRSLKRLEPLLELDYPERVLAQTPERLPGIGPKLAAALARRELASVEDLLFLLPRAYEDRRELSSIAGLQVGQAACFEGRILRAALVPGRAGKRFLQAVVSDGSASVALKWFRGAPQLAERVQPGARVLVSGPVKRYRYALEIHHPELEFLGEDDAAAGLARIVPVYPVIEGMAPRSVRRIAEAALAYAGDLVDAFVPEGSGQALALPAMGESLTQVHCPGVHLDPEQLRVRDTPYHRRLVAEELFLLQVGLVLGKGAKQRVRAQPLQSGGEFVERARMCLPFELTGDQRRAWAEIARDLARPYPMNRLLLGDVGTGKTALAMLATAAAHASGGLSAVLAPTEILARQHYASWQRMLGSLGVRCALLTGSTRPAERRSLLRLLQLGELAVVIGTHALLTEKLELPALRLAVIDEQQRFGVAQRAALQRKGEHPHLLAMSATPIPRTLALTVFGDLDQSQLRERPPGRAPVQTRVVSIADARAVLAELRETVARGEQAYVIYPLVEESEVQDLIDATRGYERLRASLPEARTGLVHGQLDPADRNQRMEAFAAGELDVLVATTVIEVGVDVPRATLLVVRHAERFGLAQLHQLRGRVGRGGRPGRALLVADPAGAEAARRLAVLESTASGFEIAEEDLRLRGAGEWLGTRQAGHIPELRLADLVAHEALHAPLRSAAEQLIAADPGLARHAPLRSAVQRRWGRRLAFGSIA